MQTRKFFILDLSGCKNLPPGYEGIKEIPLVEGTHQNDFDILEDELPINFCNFIRYETEDAKKHIEGWADVPGALEEIDYMPMSVRLNCWPEGAVLRER